MTVQALRTAQMAQLKKTIIGARTLGRHLSHTGHANQQGTLMALHASMTEQRYNTHKKKQQNTTQQDIIIIAQD